MAQERRELSDDELEQVTGSGDGGDVVGGDPDESMKATPILF